MKWLLALLLVCSIASADFILESVDVKINNIENDGSATVTESIKFLIKGDFAKAVYDGGIQTTDDLSVWSNNTGLSEVKLHVNPAVVAITNLRLQPQPRSGCNPFTDICHGELTIDYQISPVKNNSQIMSGTGLFFVEQYKPRTTRYILNHNALSFKKTEAGNFILDPEVRFSLELPAHSDEIRVTPAPNTKSDLTYTWNDMVLVRLSVIFEVEEAIDKEVSRFFSDVLGSIQSTIASQHGMSFLLIIGILVGSYIYISISKKKKEG
jgi:hypothetical protein